MKISEIISHKFKKLIVIGSFGIGILLLSLSILYGLTKNKEGLPPPYPRSNLITGVAFQPVSEIHISATGSDNWPLTWAADNDLYTSYGDGWGFEPKTETKLSLGLAKIKGFPPNFVGINIRSESAEDTGDGKTGLKSSGILMVDDILYMLVRNVDRQGRYSRLMWSEDYGKSWHKGFQLYKDFGCPTFLNYGKNYNNAKDNYVYIYSQQGPSAYESYDAVVLARVNKRSVKNPSLYEYFAGYDPSGIPHWTASPDKLQPIFSFPENCARMDVAYNPGIDRYLMTLSYDGQSGWGLYESDNPWGEWKTVYHTMKWDVPHVHGFRIPTKWISQNGKTINLIFSGSNKYGYDGFCIREMYLQLP